MYALLLTLFVTAAFAEEDDGDISIEPQHDSPENGDFEYSHDTEVEVWEADWDHSDSVWGDEYETPVGDFSWDVAGYEAEASASAGFDDNGLELEASASARAYLAQVGYEIDGQWGSDETHIGGNAEADAYVGADASVNAELDINFSEVEVEVEAEAFAGAKAEAGGGVDLAVCDIGVSGDGSVEASAGIGGTAAGEVDASLSDLEFDIGFELAGTLGIGTGGSTSLGVDLGGLTNPAGTADCFWDGAFEAGRSVVNAGDAVWDKGWDIGSSALSGLGGLFGGGGDDDFKAAIVVAANQAAATKQMSRIGKGNDLIRDLDRQLSPQHGRPGICY